MKRTYPSGASKRRQKNEQEKAKQSLPRLTTFFNKKNSTEQINGTVNPENEITDDALSQMANVIVDVDAQISTSEQIKDSLPAIQIVDDTNMEKNYLSSNPPNIQEIEASTSIHVFNDDVALLNKKNIMQMEEFLKIENFKIPENIPNDAENHKFPYRLTKKVLANGEVFNRDWLCWSNSKKSLFCFPCFLRNTEFDASASVLGSQSGWDILKGWRKLKDRVPAHENSIFHKENYVRWKSASRSAILKSSIGSSLLKQLNCEASNWEKVLYRILDVIFFLSERGLALLGSNENIGNPRNGNFLGIIELLSKYDPVLYEHVKNVRESQDKNKRLQVHYLSSRIQNEFIEICGKFVQRKILDEIIDSKYFSIIVDATPDCSHQEQTCLVIRYVKIINNASYSIEERFITFDSFTEKKGTEIAARIIEIIEIFGLDFNLCVGQAYDNGANMAGQYNGVQALLRERNPNCIFSSCGNHTLNLVGVDSAESCKEAVTYFGRIQQMYNFFSSSPRKWEILKKHISGSLHTISKTRWSARIDAVKPIFNNQSNILAALEECKSLNLPPHARTELQPIFQYLDTFECILLTTIWLEILTLLQQTNLIIEARNATLDVEKENIDHLIARMRIKRDEWDRLLLSSKEIAVLSKISNDFQLTRHIRSQFDAEEHYRVNVFIYIIDSVIAGLTRRFESLGEICQTFGFLWTFQTLSEEEINSRAKYMHLKYPNEISNEICDETIFLKNIFAVNFDAESSPAPAKLLLNILEKNLIGLFPNVSTALRIFLSLPASVASAERSFSVLKRVKNFNRSAMSQERLNGLSTLHINSDIARNIDFSSIIKDFANTKARKAYL